MKKKWERKVRSGSKKQFHRDVNECRGESVTIEGKAERRKRKRRKCLACHVNCVAQWQVMEREC